MRNFDVGHLGRHRHQVIGKRAVLELSIFAVEALLKECRSQTLHHAAANLLLNEQRINDATAIFDDRELQDLYEAGLDVDLDMAGLILLVNANGKPFGAK